MERESEKRDKENVSHLSTAVDDGKSERPLRTLRSVFRAQPRPLDPLLFQKEKKKNSFHQVPTAGHLLGPLAGLRVCLTGGTTEDKRPIVQALERAGALHYPDLTRDCTHLVVVRELSPTTATAATAAAAANDNNTNSFAPAPLLQLPPPPSMYLPRQDIPSNKERYARQWDLPVLWDSWVAAAAARPRYSRSLEKDHLVPESSSVSAAAAAGPSAP